MEQSDSNSKKLKNSQLIWLSFLSMFFGVYVDEWRSWSRLDGLVARNQGTAKKFELILRNLVLVFWFLCTFTILCTESKHKFAWSMKVSTLTRGFLKEKPKVFLKFRCQQLTGYTTKFGNRIHIQNWNLTCGSPSWFFSAVVIWTTKKNLLFCKPMCFENTYVLQGMKAIWSTKILAYFETSS